MASELSEAILRAAKLREALGKAYEPIFAALGYSQIPAEHVVNAVVEGVDRASITLGTDSERIELFRVRKAIEAKRAMVVPEKDRCETCGEPRAFADEDGMCPECWS
jgi:hypothetical protein